MTDPELRLEKLKKLCSGSSAGTEFVYWALAGFFEETFAEMMGRSFGWKEKFDVLPRELKAQKFFYSQSVFDAARVPFFEWEDVASGAIQVVHDFIFSEFESVNEVPGYDAFMNLRNSRLAELSRRPEYEDALRFDVW
jgi:hypothetical protein